jgi:hypothetical protein
MYGLKPVPFALTQYRAENRVAGQLQFAGRSGADALGKRSMPAARLARRAILPSAALKAHGIAVLRIPFSQGAVCARVYAAVR